MEESMNQRRNPQKRARHSIFATLNVLLCFLLIAPFTHADVNATNSADPHYTPVGFFDLHVCYWTDRPMFFLVVFSTERFNDIKSVDVLRPNGQLLMSMDLSRHRVILRKNKPEKRSFVEQFSLPPDATDGWYTARIALHNGEQFIAKDYVIMYTMAPATGMIPPDGAENVPVPSELRWNPVPGATHYKVYIKDLWEGRFIHESKLLTHPRLDLPSGLIKPGGDYSWRVHARDVNENVLLGDFNHGSFTGENKFGTSE
jgi:hypothetical protein